MSRAIDFLKNMKVFLPLILRKMRNGERKTRLGWNGHVTSPCL